MTNIDKANTNTIDAKDKRARELAAEIERNNFQALDNISHDLKIDKLLSYEDLKKKQELIYEGSLTSDQLHYVNSSLLESITYGRGEVCFGNTREEGSFNSTQIRVLYWLLKDRGFKCTKLERLNGNYKHITITADLKSVSQ